MRSYKQKINERILKEIRENSKNDEAIRDFLIDIVFEEVENPDLWRWKEIYNNGIEKFLKREDTDENLEGDTKKLSPI